MSRALARRVYCRVAGTPAEALTLHAQIDPQTKVGRLGEAVLLYPGPGTPWAMAIGVGLDDTPAEALVAGLDAFFGPLDASPEILLTPFASAAVIQALNDGGFRLKSFRHLLVADTPLAVPPSPAGLTWSGGPANGVIARGFRDGADPSPEALAMESMFALPQNVTTFMANLDGRPAGGGRVAICDGVALLFGASVVPEFRRRGVQTALLARRVAFARAEGADLIVVESAVANGTARNALRLGFKVAFTNAVLARPATPAE